MDWVTVISQVGFPIGAALAVAWYHVNRQNKDDEKQMKREQALIDRVVYLENYRETMLTQFHDTLIRVRDGLDDQERLRLNGPSTSSRSS